MLCIGNVGSKETTEWLKDIGEEFTMVRGDEDAVSFVLKIIYEHSLVNILSTKY